jgi:outer membrane protein
MVESARCVARVLPLLLLASVEIARPQTPAPAQAPAVVHLTLKDVVQLALKQNPQGRVAHLQTGESIRDRQIAASALLPRAAMTGEGAVAQYNLNSVEASPPRRAAGPYQYIQAGPSFSQTLLNLPQIRGYQIGKEGVRQANANETTTREEVVTSAVSEYLLVLRALATRDAAQSRVALAQRLYEQASELQKTGLGLNIDTVRARVELDNERQNLIEAEVETHTTKYVLAELLVLPKEQELEVTDQMQFFALPEYDRSALLEQALKDRPEMRAIASDERITRLSRKSTQQERWPELDFSGFWVYQGAHFNDGIPAYNYQISMIFPLFTGGRIHAEVERAKLEEERIAETRAQIEAQIVREVKSSLDELEAARSAVEVANEGYKLAGEEVAQAERRFQAGVTTNIEVITAQDALARASDNQIDALYRFNQSRANLARALGNIENTYSK